MNRKDRRRSGKTERIKTYTLTDAQIHQMKNDAVSLAFEMLLGIPVLVLHDKFGFGKLRIDRFMHYALGWLESVNNGEVSINEIHRILKEEAGVEVKR